MVSNAPTKSDCIESTLCRTKGGYARKQWRGKARIHHRLVYAQYHGLDYEGPEMAGLDVMHECDNPPCINIDHLRLDTRQANMDDKVAKSRLVPSPGSRNGAAVLWEGAVDLMRVKRRQGVSLKELAEEFAVSEPTVSNICTRKTWGHVA